MKKTKLIPGKRYWFDAVKDVSGKLIGKKGKISFNKIWGNKSMYIIENGVINFALNIGFHPVK